EAARQECLRRSPRAVLDNARRAGVPVYIGHGLQDRLVPPNHAVWAFNHLVGPGGALTEAETTSIARNVLPGHLAGRLDAETFFRPGDPTPLYSRQSGNVTLVLFQGGHNAVFNPGLEWMVHREAASQPSTQVRGAVARLSPARRSPASPTPTDSPTGSVSSCTVGASPGWPPTSPPRPSSSPPTGR